MSMFNREKHDRNTNQKYQKFFLKRKVEIVYPIYVEKNAEDYYRRSKLLNNKQNNILKLFLFSKYIRK
jgi:hypothetical protein